MCLLVFRVPNGICEFKPANLAKLLSVDGILRIVSFSIFARQFFVFAALSCLCQGVWDANMMAAVAYAWTLFFLVNRTSALQSGYLISSMLKLFLGLNEDGPVPRSVICPQTQNVAIEFIPENVSSAFFANRYT